MNVLLWTVTMLLTLSLAPQPIMGRGTQYKSKVKNKNRPFGGMAADEPICTDRDGSWGGYGPWSECDCDSTRMRVRTRQCDDPEPMGTGASCDGPISEAVSCSDECDSSGCWTSWEEWKSCDCKLKTTSRLRHCDTHGKDTSKCAGKEADEKVCDMEDCPVDGDWSKWSQWSDCDCGDSGAMTTRTRECNDPAPQNGGFPCMDGKDGDSQTKKCKDKCPVDGGWSDWSGWDKCNCKGDKMKKRWRKCNSPRPDNGGDNCDGLAAEAVPCTTCGVSGGWGTWGEWTDCPCSSSNPETLRFRLCDNPAPNVGGTYCTGKGVERENCQDDCTRRRRLLSADVAADAAADVAVDDVADFIPIGAPGRALLQASGWTDWSTWGGCACIGVDAVERRTRECEGSNPCNGDDKQDRDCDNDCSVTWNTWSDWSLCDCQDLGVDQLRTRSCSDPDLTDDVECDGPEVEVQACTVSCSGVNWAEWSDWNDCACYCSLAITNRTRDCLNEDDVPVTDAVNCDGADQELLKCDIYCVPPFFDDGDTPEWGTWGPWSPWLFDDDSGNTTRTRDRECVKVDERECDGESTQTQHCEDANKCPVDGEWGTWGSWGGCKCSGNVGLRISKRNCNKPKARHGGAPCTGDKSRNQLCAVKDQPSCNTPILICEFCDFTNWAVGHYRDPLDCSHFYTCLKDMENPKKFIQISNEYCPSGTYWSHSSQTCDWISNLPESERCHDDLCSNPEIPMKEDDLCVAYQCWPRRNMVWRQCCEPGHYFSLEERACLPNDAENECTAPCDFTTVSNDDGDIVFDVPDGYCGQGNFIYYTHPSNPHKFYMVDPFDLKDELKMECPDVFGDKMVFNDSVGVCSCLYDGPVDTCEDEEGLVVYVPFDDHIHDISCDQIPSESMGEVYLVPGCVKGNCLEFEGGKVELLHFNNWFGSHVSEFTISFWYKWLNALPGLPQGLVHNGNCVTEPTIDIIINTNDNIKGSVNTEPGINMEAVMNEWVHVVMVFNQGKVELYQNNTLVGMYYSSDGTILDTDCVLTLGYHKELNTGFYGRMDEVFVYDRALSVNEIDKLFRLERLPQP